MVIHILKCITVFIVTHIRLVRDFCQVCVSPTVTENTSSRPHINNWAFQNTNRSARPHQSSLPPDELGQVSYALPVDKGLSLCFYSDLKLKVKLTSEGKGDTLDSEDFFSGRSKTPLWPLLYTPQT